MGTRLATVWTLILITAVFEPAKLIRGDAPHPAPQTVGWEHAVLRASVNEHGTVDAIETVAGTERLSAALRRTVPQWRFQAAAEGKEPVASSVMIASIYRPPALHDVPPFDGLPIHPGVRSEGLPLPASMSAPAYPPRAQGDGTVVVEVRLRADGEVQAAIVIRSTASGFDSSAVQAALRWRFHPATRQGSPVPAYAYLVFGFRQPVVVIK